MVKRLIKLCKYILKFKGVAFADAYIVEILSADSKLIHARALLENPCFTWIMQKLEKDAAEAWANSHPNDFALRENIYCQQVAIRLIRQEIIGMINSAQFEIHKQEAVSASAARENEDA